MDIPGNRPDAGPPSAIPPDVDDLVDALRRAGAQLAAAARAGPADAVIDTCPGWTMRDLVHHTGAVHRWATRIVAEAAPTPVDNADLETLVGGWPDDADLGAWMESGCDALAATLIQAPPDLDCWTFFAAPSPRHFWARRQAHETTIHRVDAEGAATAVTPVPDVFAADGVDEILSGFATRARRLRGAPATLVVAADAPAFSWRVRLGPDAVTVERAPTGTGAEPERADDGGDTPWCAVAGPAPALYWWLWNRGDGAALTVSGDADVLARWHDGLSVSWR
jgi:uncharacterized protein (TIGR03083 family)